MDKGNEFAHFSEDAQFLSSLVKDGKGKEVLRQFGVGFLYSLPGEDRITLEQILKISQESAVDCFNAGILALEENDLKEAEKQFKKAAEMDPAYASPYYNLALILESRGETAKAQEAWKKFIKLEEKYRFVNGVRITCETDNFDFLANARTKI